ncbi:MAG: JAB domain-containing protein [Candidatus Sungbacteria bacterium]|nr:JAB domain-containing protein [Candidatus Sungbacteria bacterium]
MPNIQSVIKNIQDIMRKDAGVDGDAQRLSQLVWKPFLKIFDDKEATARRAESGKLLGIELLDLIVIGKARYFCFRENGLL